MRNLSASPRVRSGFTLIELLVVVLIIGILASIALPQYQKATAKSRLATLIPLVKTVADAKRVHYLSTGEWARRFDELSVSVPSQFTIRDDSYYGQSANYSGTYIYLDAGGHQVRGVLNLFDGSFAQIYISPEEGGAAHSQCQGTRNKLGEALCKSLPGATYVTGDDNNVLYNIF